LKKPVFIDVINQYLENNFSVVIFVNFTNTLLVLEEKFRTDCGVYGKQTVTERLKNIDDFVNNKKKIIICNITSGAESISLDDTRGTNPRISLISPTWVKEDLLQAFGRTHRASTKSTALNKIIYCTNTIEENMCNKIKSKLNDLSKIENSDMLP
jgi:superfamily II DNA or RNA helicase